MGDGLSCHEDGGVFRLFVDVVVATGLFQFYYRSYEMIDKLCYF